MAFLRSLTPATAIDDASTLLAAFVFSYSSSSSSSRSSSHFPQHKKNKPTLYEFSSRDEMVHLAGYGEEKLSTILVTGTVLYEACPTTVIAIYNL
ncbi:hypothetical protein Gogos_008639, partial [Gossypium gossypioides]|nr:hypothetical protein [Gossypium gossypioides]